MISSIRSPFNVAFSQRKYQQLLAMLDKPHPDALGFRVAETPVFVPRILTDRVVEACEHLVDTLIRPDFKPLTDQAIPPQLRIPGDERHCEMMCFDFAVCRDDAGALVPQLIEMQGFPTVFFFQELLARAYRQCYDIPQGFDNYFNGYDHERYKALLTRLILGDNQPENTILLEVTPHEQKTRLDFYLTHDQAGVQPVCISELVREGDKLYYIRDGRQTRVKRIYNRMIAEDFESQKSRFPHVVDITQELDVEWLPHPNWFYRISKYTLPFLQAPYVPETRFLHEVGTLPPDLENYVLKSLFSFAGQGVIVDVKEADIAAITNPSQWILQRKVAYDPVVDTPTGMAKCELRMMYCWERGSDRPVLVNNLTRISKGKLIGVRYNEGFDWVGTSVGFFEQG